MANPPMGNNFIEGSLGVVNLNFDNVDLGKTLDEASVEFIEDMKDIMYAQDGTQPADKVPTGQGYRVSCKLAELQWDRLAELVRGIHVSGGGSGNSAKLGRDIYRSGLANFAKVLVIRRVDSDGVVSTDLKYRLTFYKAIPSASGPMGAFGPDTQRVMDVVFDCFYDATAGHECFGYSGYATSLGMY